MDTKVGTGVEAIVGLAVVGGSWTTLSARQPINPSPASKLSRIRSGGQVEIVILMLHLPDSCHKRRAPTATWLRTGQPVP